MKEEDTGSLGDRGWEKRKREIVMDIYGKKRKLQKARDNGCRIGKERPVGNL